MKSATQLPTSVTNTNCTLLLENNIQVQQGKLSLSQAKCHTYRTEKVTNNTIKIHCISTEITSLMIRLAGMVTAAAAACCTRATNHPRDKSTRTMCL